MKIAVLNSAIPFVNGGAEHLARGLTDQLKQHGHQATLVRVPFIWYPPEKVIEHALAVLSMRLENVDRVIGLKFPAYLLPHHNKVLWLLHQHRQAYDLWGTSWGDPDTPVGRQVRRAIINADNELMRSTCAIYTISSVVTERLRKFNGVESEVLLHPLPKAETFYEAQDEGYMFFPSRISAIKRQYLAVEAMKHVATAVQLVVAGEPQGPGDLERLEQIVSQNGLEDCVRIVPGFISEEAKAALMSRALGCVYPPYDEDSYGYVTMESYCSRKPVVTCADSGGTLTLVEDQVNGFVVEPDPSAIATAFDRLYRDRARARRMGRAGYEKVEELEVSWERVIRCLTA